MDIRICSKNVPKLNAALALVNGRAKDHTYTGSELLHVAEAAEAYAYKILQHKKWIVLAQWESESGTRVSSSYTYPRITTVVRIKRLASGWYLTDAKTGSVRYDGGKATLILTALQARHAAILAAQQYVIGGSNEK